MKPELLQDQIAAAFCDHYDALSQIVADANRYGQSPGLEHRYATERAWMLHNYRHVKRQLARHLKPEPSTALNWTKPLDNFEKLFNSPTLTQLLHQDDTTLNNLLNSTKLALEKTFHLTHETESKLAVS